jgi:small subunit ribosomal protein S9
VARVELKSGKGESTVNQIPLADYFPTVALRDAATRPLTLTSQQDALKLSAKVTGGGKHAQADAVKLGAARALVQMNPAWRKQLKDAGMLTRDPRAKERKKAGLKRARRAPQFSKR